MHLSSHPRPSIPPPACRHPHALFSAPAGLPRGKPKNPLRSSSICYNPHHPRACRPARASVPCQPKLSRAPRLPTTAPTFSPCRPPCALAAALQHLLTAEHQHQHQHHWKPHPAPSTYCPLQQGRAPRTPASRPAHCPHPALAPSSGPAPVPKIPAPPRCLSFSYPGVNRQALRHLLTSATAPAAPPLTISTSPRSLPCSYTPFRAARARR